MNACYVYLKVSGWAHSCSSTFFVSIAGNILWYKRHTVSKAFHNDAVLQLKLSWNHSISEHNREPCEKAGESKIKMDRKSVRQKA